MLFFNSLKSIVSLIAIFSADALSSSILAQPNPVMNLEEHLGLSLSPEQARSMSEKGEAAAQTELGIRYVLGIGVEANTKEAEKWLLKASEQNNPVAQCNLGFLYFSPSIRDVSAAIKWLHKSANAGNTEAQSFLGSLYRQGKYVPINYEHSIKWYLLAAKKGDASSMNAIGLLYMEGKGVNQNYVEAATWLEKAAKLGQEAAQRHLGNLYALGRGVEQSYPKAYAWLSMAIEQNFSPAEIDKSNLIAKMSPEEIRSGELLLATLRDTKPKK